MKVQVRAACVALSILSAAVVADEAPRSEDAAADEVIVVGQSVELKSGKILVERELLVDTASALNEIPGASVNRNGLITGIAQYRGLYGDRVAVDIDQLGIISGGPNAMDTPLSYMSPMITEELVVARGIASVSLAPESIGGYVATTMSRGDFSAGGSALSGVVGARYSDNGRISTSAGRLTLSDEHHRVSAVAEIDSGDDIDTPAGEIRPSGLHRDRYDVSYAYDADDRHLLVFAGKLNTEDAGTPALPMDILVIDTNLFGAEFGVDLGDSFSVDANFGYNDVDHLMDNHSLRQAPMPAMQRLNTTSGKGANYSIGGTFRFADSSLRLGLDGIAAEHESVITNPNNAMFSVNNFTGISRDLLGVFGEWNRESGPHAVELGLRFNHVDTNAGTVGTSGMMGMMAVNVGALADDFNAAGRDLSWRTIDAVVKYRQSIGSTAEWSVELGAKSRAPSYQELYLWLPLQATGGLADGRTYIGNLDLKEERMREVVVGLSADYGRFSFTPQVFYRSVADYIQGVPSTNMTANMVSTMMNGAPPLQFDNVDANIWGMDAAWRYELTDRLLLDGILGITRGRRTDVADNLYRLAPYSGSIGLTYSGENWSLGSELVGHMRQDKVSSYNEEQETASYWLANLLFVWGPTSSLRVEARVDNLFDETYQDHVTGINRANGSGLPVGVRLFGAGRTVTGGLIYSF